MTLEARLLVQMVDFRQQPETSHIVFPPSGSLAPVAIDTWQVDHHEFLGFVNGVSGPVIAMPARANWVIYVRRLTKMLNAEDAFRDMIAHKLAMRAVEQELLKNEPVAESPRLALIPDGMAEDLVEGKGAGSSLAPSTGQYL